MGNRQGKVQTQNEKKNDILTFEEFIKKFQKEIIQILNTNEKKYQELSTDIQENIQKIEQLNEQINKFILSQNGNGIKKISKKKPKKKELNLIANENQVLFPHKFTSNKKLKESLYFTIMCKIIINTEPNMLNKNNYITLCKLIGFRPNYNLKKYELIDLLKNKIY